MTGGPLTWVTENIHGEEPCYRNWWWSQRGRVVSMRTVFKLLVRAAVDENLREIMQSAMSAAITVIALSDSDCRNF